MRKYFLHFKTITLHKLYVMIECFRLGLYWQGVVHDLSKYGPTEFLPSAKYFQGDSTPIAREKAEVGYSVAWLNHKAKNKHHWEYWTDFRNGAILTVLIPDRYIKEMFCDMVWASKAYNKDKFSRSEPLEYFDANAATWHMDAQSRDELRRMLEEYARKDL